MFGASAPALAWKNRGKTSLERPLAFAHAVMRSGSIHGPEILARFFIYLLIFLVLSGCLLLCHLDAVDN